MGNKWFCFYQNNSGGYWKGPARFVLVETDTEDAACEKAEEVGVYFDGCETGDDCHCCGDRWSRFMVKPLDHPTVCGKNVLEDLPDPFLWDAGRSIGIAEPLVLLVYANGEKKELFAKGKDK